MRSRHLQFGLTLLLALSGLSLAPMAGAWGVDGHRVIGEFAQSQLSPNARAEVGRLLSLEPGATLGSIANWADEHRTSADAAWHYVNLARDQNCRYDPARDCAQGQCVVAAIDRQAAILNSRAGELDRLKALKYLVHFVGDIHQPLHAGFADDRGGNTVQLQAYGRGTNLHALWDTALLVNWPGGVASLTHEIETAVKSPVAAAVRGVTDPARWAEESCQIVEEHWFYPDRRKLEPEYAERAQQVARNRLILASRRLAELLNRILN